MPEVATKAPERTLPHNLDAERSVLGAILIDNEAFNVAAAVIDSQAFFRDAHRRIFDRMVALNDRTSPIDLVTLKEELDRGGELDEVGGPAYIASLIDGVPRATNVEYYAKIIKEKATLRQLIFSANKILANAYARPSVREWVEMGEQRAVMAERYAAIQAERRDLTAAWTDWLDEHRISAVLEPTLPIVAPPRGDGYETAGSDVVLISLTHFWDWTGFPVVSFPAGTGPVSGLPLSASLVGRGGQDWELLALGSELEATFRS